MVRLHRAPWLAPLRFPLLGNHRGWGKMNRFCSVSNCNGIHKAQGFCSTHYGNFKVYGDPNGKLGYIPITMWRDLREAALDQVFPSEALKLAVNTILARGAV